MAYANNTTVTPERSQEHIKAALRKHGADAFGVWEEVAKNGNPGSGKVQFVLSGLTIEIAVAMVAPDSDEFCLTSSGKRRAEGVAYAAYEQSIKSRWRSLLLAITAKLDAVATGISTIEVEFLPFIVMGDGRTVADHLLPPLLEAAAKGKMPTRLALPGPKT